MEQSKIDKAWDLFSRMQRQFPCWPSTFSTCPRCTKHSARGSDACSYCLTKELAEIIGKDMAYRAAAAAQHPALTWFRIREAIDASEEADTTNGK